MGTINVGKEVTLRLGISVKEGQSLLILPENEFQGGSYNELSFF